MKTQLYYQFSYFDYITFDTMISDELSVVSTNSFSVKLITVFLNKSLRVPCFQ